MSIGHAQNLNGIGSAGELLKSPEEAALCTKNYHVWEKPRVQAIQVIATRSCGLYQCLRMGILIGSLEWRNYGDWD